MRVLWVCAGAGHGYGMRVLYVEPFEGGSHASFTRTLTSGVDADWTTLTLPGRHWKWRMRGFAVWAALSNPEVMAGHYDALWCSSYVPLAELLGLVPALGDIPRVLYFHENQLTFPRRGPDPGQRDHHFGFTQLVSALAATHCVFNSAHNRDGFLAAGRELLARMPDAVPNGWIERIASRSSVLPVPVPLPDRRCEPDPPADDPERRLGPIVLWNHRWEHDKNPEAFFGALRELVDRRVPFRVAVCGQRFSRAPAVFERARSWLGPRVIHWGYCETAADYWRLLGRAHIAVSTADHEFFGIAMIEATHGGAFALVPDRLAYPEWFPPEHRYPHDDDLGDRLASLCERWVAGESLRRSRPEITDPVSAQTLLPRYAELLHSLS